MHENRIYAIVDKTTWEEGLSGSGIPLEYFYTQILETAPETLRYSVCGDQFVVKSDSTSSITALTGFAETYDIGYELYDHADVLEVMATSAWFIPIDDLEV